MALFREENLEKLQEPDKLNDYIRVDTPSAWVILFVIILIIAGTVAWLLLGQADGASLFDAIFGR